MYACIEAMKKCVVISYTKYKFILDIHTRRMLYSRRNYVTIGWNLEIHKGRLRVCVCIGTRTICVLMLLYMCPDATISMYV